MKTKRYRAGNCLRGWFEGNFSNIDEAWSYLSTRILISFPTDDNDGVRSIVMFVEEINNYGFAGFTQCKQGETERNKLRRTRVLKKCKGVYWIR